MSFYDPCYPRRRVIYDLSQGGLTEQSHARDCDVHTIIDRFHKTGLLTHQRNFAGHYADISNFPNLQEAMHTVFAAQDAFAELPSKVREKFAHDPFTFIEFMQNPANLDEMRSLGLVTSHIQPSSEPQNNAS